MSTPPDSDSAGRSALPDARPQPSLRPLTPEPLQPVQPQPIHPQFPPAEEDLPARRTWRGCGLPGMALGTVVLSLIVLALLLPPLSLGKAIRDAIIGAEPAPTHDRLAATGLSLLPLNAESPLSVDGLSLQVAPGEESDAYRVNVTMLDPADYLAGAVPATGWNCAPDLPAGHALASRVYSLVQDGTPPAGVIVRVVPSDGGARERGLELRVWNATNAAWEFVPGQALADDGSGAQVAELSYLPRCVALFREPPSARVIGAALAVLETFDAVRLPVGASLYPAGARPLLSGELDPVLPTGIQTEAGYSLIPIIQNFDDPAMIDVATVTTLLENPARREAHARAVAAFTLRESNVFSGVAIDYRGLPAGLRDAYSAFLRDTAGRLHEGGATLTVILPAPTFDDATGRWLTGAYDWVGIGQAADTVVIMLPRDPMAYAPGGSVEALIAWATGQVSRSNLLLGVSALGVEDQGTELFAPVALGEALARWSAVQVDTANPVEAGASVTARLAARNGMTLSSGVEGALGAAYIELTDASGERVRRIWPMDAAALHARVALASHANLAGILVWDLWQPGTLPGLSDILSAYRVGREPALEAADLAVIWTVRAGEIVIEQAAEALDAPFIFEAPANYLSLSVEARLDRTILGSADLVVAAPEPTPSPSATPDATFTPDPESVG